jgi:hypothetical protein
MNHYRNPQPLRMKSRAYRRVFERLDAALAENTLSDNYEKIRLMRLAMFADVDRLRASGKLIIPKP